MQARMHPAKMTPKDRRGASHHRRKINMTKRQL
jgi:hypothetical protein